AFTTKTTPLNYGSIAALAAASRALTGYNDELAKESLAHAKRAWAEEAAKDQPDIFRHGNTTGGPLHSEHLKAATELLITTGERQYAEAIEKLLPEVQTYFGMNASWLLRAMPHMPDSFKQKIRALAEQHVVSIAEAEARNPFGVPI